MKTRGLNHLILINLGLCALMLSTGYAAVEKVPVPGLYTTPNGLNWSLQFSSRFKQNNHILGQTISRNAFRSHAGLTVGMQLRRSRVLVKLEAKNSNNSAQALNIITNTHLFDNPSQLFGGASLQKAQINVGTTKQLETKSFFAGFNTLLPHQSYLNIIGSLNDWSVNDSQEGRAPTFNAVVQRQNEIHLGALKAQITLSGLIQIGGARYNAGHKTQGFGASLTASQNFNGVFLNTSLSLKNQKLDGYHIKDQGVTIGLSNHPVSNAQSAIRLVTLT